MTVSLDPPNRWNHCKTSGTKGKLEEREYVSPLVILPKQTCSGNEYFKQQAESRGQIDYDSDDSSEWPDDPIETLEGARDSGKATTSKNGRNGSQLPEKDAELLRRADDGNLSSSDEMSLARVAGLKITKPPKSQQMPLMW